MAGPTVRELLLLVAQGELSHLCLWGEEGDVTVFRNRLRAVLQDPQLYAGILKICRVTQPNNRVRFDLFMAPNTGRQLLWAFKASARARQYHWYCRSHIPYRDRQGRNIARTIAGPPPMPQPRARASGNFRVGTYNINGMHGKRTNLRAYLQLSKVEALGLQETLLKARDWQLRLPHYACFSTPAVAGPSVRGVAIVISKKFTCSVVGTPSSYWIFARIMGGDLRAPLLFGTVYVPHNPRDKQLVLRGLPLEVASLKHKFPDDPIILTGDFNMIIAPLQQLSARWPVPLQVLPNRGGSLASHKRGRTIDHIMYWGTPEAATVPPTTVLDTWDLSDHYPVVGLILALKDRQSMVAPVTNEAVLSIRVYKPEQREDIVTKGRDLWTDLYEDLIDDIEEDDEIEDLDVETTAARWYQMCFQVAEASNVCKEQKADAQQRPSLPKGLLRAIRRRRKHHGLVNRARRQNAAAALLIAKQKYEKAKLDCRRLIRHQNTKRWRKSIRPASGVLEMGLFPSTVAWQGYPGRYSTSVPRRVCGCRWEPPSFN